MSATDRDVRSAAEQIERYLEDHPNAADTVKGIAAWWLPDAPEPIVQAALDDLVRRGSVRREEVTGGLPQYSRATHRRVRHG
jgi:hypothetical protein